MGTNKMVQIIQINLVLKNMASYPSDFANGSNNTNKLSPQELSIQLFTHSAVQIIQINLVLKNKKGAHCASDC